MPPGLDPQYPYGQVVSIPGPHESTSPLIEGLGVMETGRRRGKAGL